MKQSRAYRFQNIKICLPLFFFLNLTLFCYGQTQTENYIKTIKHKEPGNSSFRDIAPNTTVVVHVTYFDGLGRAKQQLAHRQSGTGADLVTHIEYDALGRQIFDYLPYERTSNSSMPYEPNAKNNTLQFYNTSYYQNTNNPYSEKKLENSPLNRLLEQASPGNDWAMGNGNEIKIDHQTNSNSDVYHFKVINPNSTPTLSLHTNNNGKYPANQLYKTVTKDENWKMENGLRGTVVEFKNKLGQVILKRIFSTINGKGLDTTIKLDTYYVYDDYGNLTFVLSPNLSEQIVNGTTLVGNHEELLNELGYRYKYDYRNRLIYKKIPGKRFELIAYDVLDRVIAVGPVPSPFIDSNAEGWLHTKYDIFNRVVYTFWTEGVVSSENRQLIQIPQTNISEYRTTSPNTIDNIQINYSNQVLPASGKLLTINYYDDYSYYGAPSIPTEIEGQDIHYNNTNKPKGLPTGSWVRVLENSVNTNATTSYTFYDNKSRPIRIHTNNYLGGYTQMDSKYNFIGNVLYSITRHKRESADTEILIKDDFTYNNQERLITHTHKIGNNMTQLLSHHSYDALGQLISKNVGGSDITGASSLQKVDYTYNIRGWLTDINNVANLAQSGEPQDLFAFKINYNTVSNSVEGNVVPLYNGNIAETFWRTSSDNIRRKYGYTYDYQNRLLDAWYQIPGSTVPLMNSFNEHLTYDSNGNIQTLYRNGEHEDASIPVFTIDQLAYAYDLGNKLLNVTDTTNYSAGFDDGNNHETTNDNDFEYDTYGNLIIDRNKGITEISYNHLNLPKKITFGTQGTITYLYDATGQKLKKNMTEGTNIQNTEYLDGFQYTQDVLDFFPHKEGYVKVVSAQGVGGGSSFNYVFSYTDHLGNIRLRYTKTETQGLAILEENHYYPFGLKHNGYNSDHKIFEFNDGTNTVVLTPVTPSRKETYKYKFNGMEYQTELNINLYDFGARNYDPALGRWMNVDPLAEEYPDWTPYRYGFNNPVRYTDPTGMLEWDPQVNEDGSVSYIAEAGDSAETFASQYGLDQSTAESITGTTGNTEIAEGTEVSGGKVKEVTGSEVLKLDLDSPEGQSSQRRFDHFMFAADHSRSQGAWSFLSTDYFSNTQFKDMMRGWATATTGDRSFQVYYNIPMYRSATFDGSGTGVGISNSPFTIRQRGGSLFGPQQDNVRGEILHPSSGNNMGHYDIQVHRTNSDNLNKRMRQEFPTYNYIILPKILKN